MGMYFRGEKQLFEQINIEKGQFTTQDLPLLSLLVQATEQLIKALQTKTVQPPFLPFSYCLRLSKARVLHCNETLSTIGEKFLLPTAVTGRLAFYCASSQRCNSLNTHE